MADKAANPEAVDRARQLRREATLPERVLWGILRGGRLAGLKFRRQHPIGPYVADFYCHASKLIVELDGESHNATGKYDQRRDEYLRRQGLRVLRVLNEDVLNNIDAVAVSIVTAAGVELR